jgi:undecaprenyl diphosphate synthase
MENKIKHIAIIMDGNGRWAKNRDLKRIEGHKRGAEVVREITTHCAKIGIEFLTLYAFSTENWKRPKAEVEFLMKLLDRYLKNELKTYMKNDIKFETIGDISKFSKKLQDRIIATKEKTKNNKSLTQILALNYGSRDEMIRAIKKLTLNNLEINEENISKSLDTAKFSDPDILIRTSGEIRVSNFMLWQIAYSEMFFTKTLWPDFSAKELDDIIAQYKKRQRRFGGI